MTSLLKEDLARFQEKMKSIENDLSIKLLEIEEKSKEYVEKDRIMDNIKNSQEDHPISINVGGKLFTTKFSTLVSVKDTFFYVLILQFLQNGQRLPKEFFIDRSPQFFEVVLDYLRNQKVNLRVYAKNQIEDINRELEFYGVDLYSKGRKYEIDIGWDQGLSKPGMCTVDGSDSRNIRVHSTSCYCHFMTNKLFEDNENFIVEFESTVTQTDNYYYLGIINESYSTTNNCMCCNPANSYYIQCEGGAHVNGVRHQTNLAWHGSPVTIGMKVMLSEKQIYFYKDTQEDLQGPYMITSGNKFRVVGGHCNTGNGELKIKTCYFI
jgi:hypothetical protein